jgi:hypothetical protein
MFISKVVHAKGLNVKRSTASVSNMALPALIIASVMTAKMGSHIPMITLKTKMESP